jgi:ATP-dependent Clp protease ATP-binding subunit ClpC
VSWGYEHDHHVFFTYPAVVKIAESADRYVVEGVMPDKAVSLMAEIASRAEQSGVKIILDSFVNESVQAKTGIPTGPVTDKERELLVHLEDVLHERVIGQRDAIKAIASAMRRARAGIQSSERPISSFLFLGSTGVGKTETAKALAYTFFGSEDTMLRFDMSEFSDSDGLSRLVGTSAQAGALSSALREHPYSVVLLDEFEKSSESVHDLFLQILDEGMFTDAKGAQVNARNCIIIATSNAGSDIIFEYVKKGEKPADHKDEIIDTIINRAIYKPELINRFDAVVLFETLGETEQKQIAGLMLQDLQKRMRDRGYELVVDDMLIEVLMMKGFDPEFGARPLRRAIQDVLEERIAAKIIRENLQRGAIIQFTPEDFAE